MLHLVAGHACAGLGIVGVFVPILPTTPFLLLAVYFYSRSSDRLHDWILHHPRFGAPVREWVHHGVIRPRAKVLAVLVLALSMTLTLVLSPLPPGIQVALAGLAAGIAAFLVTRPSRPRGPATPARNSQEPAPSGPGSPGDP